MMQKRERPVNKSNSVGRERRKGERTNIQVENINEGRMKEKI